MTVNRKNIRRFVTIFSLVVAVSFALLFGGCADAPYANNGVRAPEAKYDTYYAPNYYPYYPWYAYYGGAYYYDE